MRTPDDPAWSVVDLATNAFGQGIAVTPLQMLNAVAAIGNDGVLMQPTIVKEMDGPDGPHRVEPRQIRRVVSAETARTLREMMVAVIEQPALAAESDPGRPRRRRRPARPTSRPTWATPPARRSPRSWR